MASTSLTASAVPEASEPIRMMASTSEVSQPDVAGHRVPQAAPMPGRSSRTSLRYPRGRRPRPGYGFREGLPVPGSARHSLIRPRAGFLNGTDNRGVESMKAAIFRGPGDVEVGERPDPVIQAADRCDRAGRAGLRVRVGPVVLPRRESRTRSGRSGTSSSASSRRSARTSTTVAVGDLVVAPVHLQRHVLPALPERLDDQLRAGRQLRQRHDRRRPGRGRAGPARRQHPRPGPRLRPLRRHAARRCSPCPTSCRPATTPRSAPA